MAIANFVFTNQKFKQTFDIVLILFLNNFNINKQWLDLSALFRSILVTIEIQNDFISLFYLERHSK